ncbi:hypothetical protein Q3G72_027294 [Acer saccharum]|nr:hypothetical protein Q3G72_027294 [Acer saccharum]
MASPPLYLGCACRHRGPAMRAPQLLGLQNQSSCGLNPITDPTSMIFRAATATATPTHRHFTLAVDLSAACPSLSICHLPPIIVNQSSSVGRRLSVITRSSSSHRVAARRLQLVQLFIDQQGSIAGKVHDSYILPDVGGSDHCPIGLVLKL